MSLLLQDKETIIDSSGGSDPQEHGQNGVRTKLLGGSVEGLILPRILLLSDQDAMFSFSLTASPLTLRTFPTFESSYLTSVEVKADIAHDDERLSILNDRSDKN